MLFNKKEAHFSERAATVVSSLQRDAFAMVSLRTRLEAKMKGEDFAASKKAELFSTLLNLVRASESALDELAGTSESLQYLNEFMAIISRAADSVSAVRSDMEKAIPEAEKALEEIMGLVANWNVTAEQETEGEAATAKPAETSISDAPAVLQSQADCQSEQPGELAA